MLIILRVSHFLQGLYYSLHLKELSLKSYRTINILKIYYNTNLTLPYETDFFDVPRLKMFTVPVPNLIHCLDTTAITKLVLYIYSININSRWALAILDYVSGCLTWCWSYIIKCKNVIIPRRITDRNIIKSLKIHQRMSLLYFTIIVMSVNVVY